MDGQPISATALDKVSSSIAQPLIVFNWIPARVGAATDDEKDLGAREAWCEALRKYKLKQFLGAGRLSMTTSDIVEFSAARNTGKLEEPMSDWEEQEDPGDMWTRESWDQALEWTVQNVRTRMGDIFFEVEEEDFDRVLAARKKKVRCNMRR